jgi:peptidyl-prolyl cis-trans isomerase SurA
MNQLAIGDISEPVVSRFGIHLIKVADRKETPVEIKKLRDMARLALREQKSEATLSDWLQELRSRAFIEYREVPQ